MSELSRALETLGHNVVVLSGGRVESPDQEVYASGLEVVWHLKRTVARRYLYPTGMMKSLRRLSAWTDVIHVHQPFAIGTWLAATTRKPLVATLHLHSDDIVGARARAQLWCLLQRVDLVAADCRAELRLIETVRRPRRAGVIMPAVRFRPRRVPKSALVLSVGRLTADKGAEIIIPAMLRLPAAVEVAAVGGSREFERWAALCKDAGRIPSEVLRGGDLTDEDVDDLFGRAAVFVSASRQEAFGIALLKSIAYGCRPLVSDIPSHREIIEMVGLDPAECLFPLGLDPTNLSTRIEAALGRPEIDRAISDRVPTWEDSAQEAVALYSQAIGSRS